MGVNTRGGKIASAERATGSTQATAEGGQCNQRAASC